MDEYLSARLSRAVAQAEATVRETRAPQHLRLWSDPPRGDPSLLDITAFPILDDDGEVSATGVVYDDVTSEDQAVQALRRAAQERRDLVERLVDAQEHERARIAADIHDDSVQAMAAVGLRLTALRRRAQLGPEAERDMDLLQEAVGYAMDRLRRLLFDLEPPGVDDSLTAGLDAAAHFILAGSGTDWLIIGDPTADLPYAERVTAVRIAKEALTNIRKHAGATSVTIEVRRVDEGVEVAVADDGVGVGVEDARSSPGHRGVRTMEDRATVAGGWWRIERGRRHGTTVRYWLPDGG